MRGAPCSSADLGGGEEGRCILAVLRGSKLHERVCGFPGLEDHRGQVLWRLDS